MTRGGRHMLSCVSEVPISSRDSHRKRSNKELVLLMEETRESRAADNDAFSLIALEAS